jgi:hypothetical protein
MPADNSMVFFYFPTKASPTTTLSIVGPVGGGQPVSPKARYVSGRTVNGTTYAYQKNDVTQSTWTLKFVDITRLQKAALQTYFNDIVKGPSLAFDYLHTNAIDYPGVRFLDNVLEFSRIDGGAFFSCSIKLLIDGEVDD